MKNETNLTVDNCLFKFNHIFTDKIEKTGTKELKSILKSLGNWPVVVGESWNQSKFDWQKLIHQLRKTGYTGSMNSLINFNIETDEKNTTRRTVTVSF